MAVVPASLAGGVVQGVGQFKHMAALQPGNDLQQAKAQDLDFRVGHPPGTVTLGHGGFPLFRPLFWPIGANGWRLFRFRFTGKRQKLNKGVFQGLGMARAALDRVQKNQTP